ESLLHQTIDDQQRVGRIGAAGKQLGKLAQPIGHELRDVLRVHKIGGELDHVAETGTGGFERRLDIGEGLHALRVEIVTADDLAVLDRYLPGDEQKLRRLDASHVRILPERLSQRVGIKNLDVGHGAVLHMGDWYGDEFYGSRPGRSSEI